jgi:hypothetical protein
LDVSFVAIFVLCEMCVKTLNKFVYCGLWWGTVSLYRALNRQLLNNEVLQ